MLRIHLLSALLCWGHLLHAQLITNNTVNAADGVQNVLIGGGVSVSNITFTGANEQIGSFTCSGGCNLNISSGLVMASGNIDAAGGNAGGSTSLNPASGWGISDGDLEILGGSTYNDAAVLEFDFVPQGDSLVFNFVFGSEEYPEFVNGGFNDAFGFFISGPGFNGPFSGNAENVALIPGTSTPVTIDNVNAGSFAQYFVTNSGTGASVIEADGFTTVLQAFAEVVCGETYHLKLAIADAVDTGYDSYVFLEAGSFSSNQVAIDFLAPNLAPTSNGIYEGCASAAIEFTRPLNQNSAQAFALSFSGAAQNLVDFSIGNDSLIFAENQASVSLPINAIQDGVLEGLENLIITVEGLVLCGADTQIEVQIADLPVLQVDAPVVEINCGMQATFTPTISGGLGNYVIAWENGSFGPSWSVSPNEPTTYTFTVSDTCGVTPINSIATVNFTQNPPLVVELGPNIVTNCLETINLSANPSGGFGNYSIEWEINQTVVGAGNALSVSESNDVFVEVEVTDACGTTGSDQLQISYPEAPIQLDLGPSLSGTCLDVFEIVPQISGGVGAYSYSWLSQEDALIGTASDLNYQTATDTEIALEVVDQCGNSAVDWIEIAIPQVAVTVDIGPDLTTTCTAVNDLASNVNGGVGAYAIQWSFNGTPISNAESVAWVAPGDGLLTFTVEDGCGNMASDLLQVTVPPVPVFAELGPNRTTDCITIETLVPVASGGIGAYSYVWSTGGEIVGYENVLEIQSIANTVVEVQVTDACGNSTTDEVFIAVPPVPISVSASNDTLICKNETVVLEAMGSGGVGNLNYSWSNSNNTTNSISTAPVNSTVYTVFVADQCGNNSSAEIQVQVVDIQPMFTYAYAGEFEVAFTNLTDPLYDFYWAFSDGSISYERNPVHTFTDLNFWHATLIAETEGCKRSVEETFYPNGNLFVPNCFTPDQDGINDVLFVSGHDIIAFHWMIFNRYGELVYESKDMSQPWDGSFMGGDHYAPDGYYHYLLTATDQRGNVFDKKGSILILR